MRSYLIMVCDLRKSLNGSLFKPL